jgi:hypothetical protein
MVLWSQKSSVTSPEPFLKPCSGRASLAVPNDAVRDKRVGWVTNGTSMRSRRTQSGPFPCP